MKFCLGSPTCTNRVPHGAAYCGDHGGARQAWQPSRPVTRVRGRALQRLREQLFEREPLCRLCRAKGITRIATIRDHVVNLQAGGTDDESNEQPICEDCHREKTQAESARGVRRSR